MEAHLIWVGVLDSTPAKRVEHAGDLPLHQCGSPRLNFHFVSRTSRAVLGSLGQCSSCSSPMRAGYVAKADFSMYIHSKQAPSGSLNSAQFRDSLISHALPLPFPHYIALHDGWLFESSDSDRARSCVIRKLPAVELLCARHPLVVLPRTDRLL